MKKSNLNVNNMNFIDVFSGAGGLSCGLELAGFKCLLGVDIDFDSINTFAKNHKHAKTYCDDIKSLDKRKLNKLLDGETVHAVVGGPPCQGFSTVGIGNPDDKRNSLFMQFVRIVKITNPMFVVVENVTGLVARKNEKTLNSIFNEFRKLGYNMDVRVMSSELYGVPEKRRRTIIIGTKINKTVTFPEPNTKKIMTVEDAFKSIKSNSPNHDIDKAQIKNSIDLERIKCVPEGKGVRYKKDEENYFPSELRFGVDWETLREGRFREAKYQRLDRNKPAPTIMTKRYNYYHTMENRYLTPREAAAIQSFPNDFIFTGSTTSQWKQIGNAVPPMLGKSIGQALLKMKLSCQQDEKNKDIEHLVKKCSVRHSQSIKNVRKSAFAYKGN